MGEVVELAGRAGWETGYGICARCLAAFVQVQPADAPERTECTQCHRMSVKFATTRELMFIKERSAIERVLEKPYQYRVEVHGSEETMAILTGLLVDDVTASLLRDRLRQIEVLLRDEIAAMAIMGQ